jgi:hypothetical protein
MVRGQHGAGAAWCGGRMVRGQHGAGAAWKQLTGPPPSRVHPDALADHLWALVGRPGELETAA